MYQAQLAQNPKTHSPKQDPSRPVGLTGEQLIAHAENNHELSSLNIVLCPDISNEDIATAVSKLPELTKLTYHHYTELSAEQIQYFLEHNIRLIARIPGSTGPQFPPTEASCTEGAPAASIDPAPVTDALYYKFSREITIEEVLKACQQNPHIKHIDLSFTDMQLTDATIPGLVQHLDSLQMLSLAGHHKITDEGLASLARIAKNLQSLNLTNCEKITDAGFSDLTKHCKSLSKLNLSGCNKISTAALEALGTHCHDLTDLNLADCKSFTAQDLLGLLKCNPNIKSLTLNGCMQLTEDHLFSIVRASPKLKSIDTLDLPSISSEDIRRLQSEYAEQPPAAPDTSPHAVSQTDTSRTTEPDLSERTEITEQEIREIEQQNPGIIHTNIMGARISNDALKALLAGATTSPILPNLFCNDAGIGASVAAERTDAPHHSGLSTQSDISEEYLDKPLQGESKQGEDSYRLFKVGVLGVVSTASVAGVGAGFGFFLSGVALTLGTLTVALAAIGVGVGAAIIVGALTALIVAALLCCDKSREASENNASLPGPS